jgi:hypothetical protein
MKISALIRELYVSPEPQSLMKDFFDRCYYPVLAAIILRLGA